MLVFTGYGLILCFAIYIILMFIFSGFSDDDATKFELISLFLSANIVATLVNYFIAKFLNRREMKHTIGAGIPLERALLFFGAGVMVFGLIILYIN